MNICILQPTDAADSPFKNVDVPMDPAPYLRGHTCRHVSIEHATAVEQVTALAGQGFDVFFNLCDGASDEARAGIEVLRTLEKLRVPFTGAASDFYEPTREEQVAACRARGVGVPGSVVARSVEALEDAARLRFPLFVKHPSSYGSLGLTRASRVVDRAALFEQGTRMIREFGSARVEEFIEGREFTVLVAENPDDGLPIAYWPGELRFPAGESFKHFDLKWKDFGDMSTVPCTEPALAERLKEASRQMFLGLNGSGYGRCDVRVNAAGEIFMLEINPNCGVFYPPYSYASADLILLNDPAGHEGFANTLIRSAFKRAGRAPPAV